MFEWLKGERKTIDDLPVVGEAKDPLARSKTDIEAVVPILSEEVDIEKRTVLGDRVRIDVETESEIHNLSEELRSETVDVVRVPIDRPVTERPTVRREGRTTIVPVLRERLVLKKELVLTEEIHITRQQSVETVEHDVELRHQTAHVTRSESD
ncbi:YsnF/AvaK domain-containing protein [uncultured Algimonas sp.]|uniref:YsnF/AvaK domain-containing protein n=1 Tax=uncultured Algimonas sp. TaxID=1547920 RepID=UPI0026016D96|nr:YsnF/AvaK domain-containing protein [uncultured Algimonas sp.]